MSKSKLTGIAPTQITDTFGSDAFRYYFLRAISVRAGRLVLLGGPGRPLPGRARERLRQPRVARDRDGRRATSSGVVPAAGELDRAPTSPSQQTVARRPPPRRMPRSSGSPSTRRSRAIWTIVDELNGYITDAGAVGAREGRRAARAARHRARHRGRGAARARGAAVAGACRRRRAKLWDGARRRGGAGRARRRSASGRRRLGCSCRPARRARPRGAVPADRRGAPECRDGSTRLPARIRAAARHRTATATWSTRRCRRRSSSPVYDNHTHLEIARRRRGRSTTASSSTARRASACAASCRSAPTSRPRAGRAEIAAHRTADARGRRHPSERRRRARRRGRARRRARR